MEPVSSAPAGHEQEAGFTLIEALIAIVMLMVGLAAVANLFVLGVGWNQIGNQASAAVTEASDVVEQLKVLPYDDAGLSPSPGPPWPAPGNCLDQDCSSGGRDYFRVRGTTDDLGALTGTGSFRGVGQLRTRWEIIGIDSQTRFIRVRSEVLGPLSGPSRADFTIFRACTAVPLGCPAP